MFKTKQKIKKFFNRIRRIKLEQHIKRLIPKLQRPKYFKVHSEFSGIVQKSVANICQKPGRSKYKRHQGQKEIRRRA